MAFWSKKKAEMPLEDFWVANIGEALQPGNRELFESDIFFILFPEARVKAEGNKSFYLNKESVSTEQFLTFVRVVHLSSCCACAFIDDQKEFSRFGHLLVSKMGAALQEDFASKLVNLKETLPLVHRAFLGQGVDNIDAWMLSGSEVFGSFEALEGAQKKMLIQANVFYSFLIDYFLATDQLIASLLQRNPAPSRDAAASLIATTRRLHDHTRQSFSTV
ncbi:hypothetical protein [Epibacterium ulvae]|uniref:hypothetical protein n=1 Tax=Epibacterium ulvae TaxID=1156985 RepID=UPI0024918468|nr:hypothetical protein [Epibacterium ulvae]